MYQIILTKTDEKGFRIYYTDGNKTKLGDRMGADEAIGCIIKLMGSDSFRDYTFEPEDVIDKLEQKIINKEGDK